MQAGGGDVQLAGDIGVAEAVEAAELDEPHSVQHTVKDDTGVAYTEACRYPDGTNVLCATVIGLDGGLIADQTVVQVWDER